MSTLKPPPADRGVGAVADRVRHAVSDWRMSPAPMAQETKVRVELAFEPA